MNDASPGEQLPPGYFQKIDNAFCSDGKISKVFGSSAINSSIATQPFNGIAAFESVTSSVKYLVASVNGASNARLYTSTGGNFTAIGSANLTNSLPVWFEVANDKLWGFNGTEVVDLAADGTTVTKNRASVPKGFYAKWFHNYLFVAHTAGAPNRLFWSDLGDPTTFTGANFVDINPGDSDQILGLAGIQDELLIFKRNTIWSITGFSGSSFSSTTIAAQNTNGRIFGYGTVAPFSIVPVGNEVYFFSMLGSTPVIRSLRKTINAVTLGGGIISDNIKGTLANITLGSLSNIAGTFDGRYVYWSIPTNASTTNNQIIALDTWEVNSSKGIYPFTTMSGKNAHAFASSTIPGYSQIYYADEGTSGKVFKFDTSVFTDNGTNITMDIKTRDYMLDLSRKSKWKYLYLTHAAGTAATLAVNARIDQAVNFVNQANLSLLGMSGTLGSFILGTSILGGQGVTTQRVTFKQLTGHFLGVEFTDSTSSNVVIHKWEIYGQTKGLRNN